MTRATWTSMIAAATLLIVSPAPWPHTIRSPPNSDGQRSRSADGRRDEGRVGEPRTRSSPSTSPMTRRGRSAGTGRWKWAIPTALMRAGWTRNTMVAVALTLVSIEGSLARDGAARRQRPRRRPRRDRAAPVRGLEPRSAVIAGTRRKGLSHRVSASVKEFATSTPIKIRTMPAQATATSSSPSCRACTKKGAVEIVVRRGAMRRFSMRRRPGRPNCPSSSPGTVGSTSPPRRRRLGRRKAADRRENERRRQPPFTWDLRILPLLSPQNDKRRQREEERRRKS